MDHIRQFLGTFCHHPGAECRQLHLGGHVLWVSARADLRGGDPNPGQLVSCPLGVWVTALIAASPMAFLVLKWIGAGFLIYLGIRGWRMAGQPVASQMPDRQQLYLKAFMIATINPKSVAGYLAAFSQFIQPDLPVISQMWAIVPTALSLTTLSYVSYCALGAGLGRTALSAVLNTYVRRILAVCFIIYGLLLGTSHFSKGA